MPNPTDTNYSLLNCGLELLDKKSKEFKVGTTLSLLVPYADNLCKKFGPRSGPKKFLLDLVPSFLTLWWYFRKKFSKQLIWKKSADDKQ